MVTVNVRQNYCIDTLRLNRQMLHIVQQRPAWSCIEQNGLFTVPYKT